VSVEAGVLEHLDRGDADLRLEVVREGVRPDDHALAAAVSGRPARTTASASPGERRDVPLGVDAAGSFTSRSNGGVCVRKLHRARKLARQPRAPVDQPEGVGGAGRRRPR
jgi:hypothetical protein